MGNAINIPDYFTIAGQRFSIGSIGKDDTRFRIQNTTEEECREYALLLEKNGFKKAAEKEIPVGSEYPYNVNLFYTYTRYKTSVFVFWDASIYTTFITVEASQPLPICQDIKTINKGNKYIAPSFTQLQLTSGMCYVVQLSDGDFIIIDGGDYNDNDIQRLYAFIKEKSPLCPPTVALWIFTHAHEDHIGLATEFIKRYEQEIEIKAFAYQFPNCDKITVSMESVSHMKAQIKRLETNIKNFFPNAVIFTLHTGQSYYYAGLEIEILFTLDNTYPMFYTSFNDTSAALRLIFDNGKKVLLLGDCMQEACRRLAHTYGDYLKSDILQVAHHGLIGGDKYLYAFVDPEICFWSTSEERFLGRLPNQRYQWCLGEGCCDYNAYLRNDKIRKRQHYHSSKTATITI